MACQTYIPWSRRAHVQAVDAKRDGPSLPAHGNSQKSPMSKKRMQIWMHRKVNLALNRPIAFEFRHPFFACAALLAQHLEAMISMCTRI